MHETAIVQDLIKNISEQAERNRASKVTKAKLKLGSLTELKPQTFEELFKVLAQGTPAQDARLEIEEIPFRAYCPDCHSDILLSAPTFNCPSCKGINIKVTSGHESYVDYIEVE